MKNKTLLILFFIFANILCAFSQNIKGTITSGIKSEGLSHATIRVLTSDSVYYNSYATDEKGRFKINIPLDRFYLIVSSIGYGDCNLLIKKENNRELDLGNIVMREDAIMLQEVSVTPNLVSEDINKMIVFPSSQQLKSSISGIDLLQHLQLPGLFVDPINQIVKIDGASGVVYRINGINSTLQQINAIKADQILRVEYNQTPSARELDINAGVINVILKKENVGTHLYTNVLGAFTTGFINGNINLKTVFSKSELSLDYNTNWRDYSKRRLQETESYHYPTETLAFEKRGRNAPFGYLTQNINLGYTFNNTENVFSIRFLNSIGSYHDRNYLDIYKQRTESLLASRDIYSKSKSYTPSVDIYYIRKIDNKQGVEANLVGTLMNSDYKRELTDTYSDYLDVVNNVTAGHKKAIMFESFYYNKKNKINFNFGLKSAYSRTNNTYNNTNKVKIDRVDVYPYVAIDSKIKNLSYSVGTGLKVLYSNDQNKTMKYYRNLTTASLFYKKNNAWNLRYVFRYTPSFPSLSDLSDIDQKQDSLLTMRGNPSVKPSQTISNQISVTYQIKKNIRSVVTLTSAKVYDPIGETYFYDSNINSFVAKTNNHSYQKRMGARAEVHLSSILKIFDISTGAIYNKYQTKGEDYRHKYNNFYWFVNVNSQYKNFSLSVGYQKPLKFLYAENIHLEENFSIVNLRYKKNNFSLSAGWYYPFTYGTKYSTKRINQMLPSNKNIYIKDNANMICIGFSYNISWGKSLFRVNKNLNNSDWDSGVIKIKDN